MNTFRTRLAALIAAHPTYKGKYAQLSRECGVSRKYIAHLLNDDKLDHSTSGPGLFIAARLAERLGVSLDDLAGSITPATKAANIAERFAAAIAAIERPAAPTSSAILTRHAQTGGELSGFADVIEYCDVYSCTGPTLKPVAIGRRSLSAATLGTTDPDNLARALAAAPDVATRALADHRAAIARGALTTIERLDGQMTDRPRRLRMEYIRTIVAVRAPSGEHFTLLHADPISN
ncbi:MAG: helix-turn-helix transcriptional regulator [Alteromonadaceae bacterium]|nr:helix-turn-helix transcriptional regulator [Alteromonadaceae bacterium]